MTTTESSGAQQQGSRHHPPSAARRGARGHLLLPGGYGRSTFEVGAPLPLAVRGEGAFLWDENGRRQFDLNNNFTALVHGHAHPAIVKAGQQAMADGACFGLPTAHEWHHAEALLERLPWMDQVRYVNSGTEAVMTAVRVARAHTGRDDVIVVRDAYHGTSDLALSTGGDHYRRGVPRGVTDDITLVGVNDGDALRRAIEKRPRDFAAIILDLLPNRAGLLALEREFVLLARELCDTYGLVLIFDEVISFRLGWSGLTPEYGVIPDMVVLGKAIGGGLPIGAVAGIERVMRELDPTTSGGLEHGGTFSANPATMSAGVVALTLLSPDAIARINSIGDEARRLANARLSQVGWEMRGRGSLFRPFPTGAQRLGKKLQRQLWWAQYERGVLVSQYNVGAVSTVMTREDVRSAMTTIAECVENLADAPVGSDWT